MMKKNDESKRRFCMHSIFKRREQVGDFHSLVKVFPIFSDGTATVHYVARACSIRHYEEGHHIQKKYIFSKKCTRKSHTLLLQNVE